VGRFLASGQPRERSRRGEERALRRLVKAGCGPEELRLILEYVGQEFTTGGAPAARLSEIAEFASSIGAPAARDYFLAIRETKAVAELTDPRVLDFARSVDPHTAEWYFWALWGTRAVRELTDDRVLRAVKFFRSIDSPATVEYFLAIRETKAAAQLTDERVLDFARTIGSDAAVEYFGACWETKAVTQLTGEGVLSLARALGGEAAREYFRAIRETRSAAPLTDAELLASVRRLGSRVAGEYFRAVRETKAVSELTDERVLLFAELIGPETAREYFRAIGSTKAVGRLTGDRVLGASGVLRSIGTDAALDYLLAAAASDPEAPPSAPGEAGRVPSGAATVPVLTLLDLPAYDRYRPAGLLGVSAFFWWSVWQFARPSMVAGLGAEEVALAIGLWVAVLVGGYALLGSLVERSTEQFLARRRRLLNEHGIRWHDCLAGDRRCEVCWRGGSAHEDERYDYGRFCRCPAC